MKLRLGVKVRAKFGAESGLRKSRGLSALWVPLIRPL